MEEAGADVNVVIEEVNIIGIGRTTGVYVCYV